MSYLKHKRPGNASHLWRVVLILVLFVYNVIIASPALAGTAGNPCQGLLLNNQCGLKLSNGNQGIGSFCAGGGCNVGLPDKSDVGTLYVCYCPNANDTSSCVVKFAGCCPDCQTQLSSPQLPDVCSGSGLPGSYSACTNSSSSSGGSSGSSSGGSVSPLTSILNGPGLPQISCGFLNGACECPASFDGTCTLDQSTGNYRCPSDLCSQQVCGGSSGWAAGTSCQTFDACIKGGGTDVQGQVNCPSGQVCCSPLNNGSFCKKQAAGASCNNTCGADSTDAGTLDCPTGQVCCSPSSTPSISGTPCKNFFGGTYITGACTTNAICGKTPGSFSSTDPACSSDQVCCAQTPVNKDGSLCNSIKGMQCETSTACITGNGVDTGQSDCPSGQICCQVNFNNGSNCASQYGGKCMTSAACTSATEIDYGQSDCPITPNSLVCCVSR